MENSNDTDCPAVLLVGGLGTRLRHLTATLPKALVPVAGRPFIEWQIQAFRRAGIRRVHLAAGYRADDLQRWAARAGGSEDADLAISVEPTPLGTGGGLQFAVSELACERLLVVNGDTLLPNLDLAALLNRGLDEQEAARMVVVQTPDAARFGTVLLRGEGKISAFLEKGQGGPGWINGGVYLLRREALLAADYVPPWSLETDWFPRLAAVGRLAAFKAAPPILDMGTPDGFAEMENFLAHPPEA